MIVLNLTCHNGHAFEGWFASRDAFDAQCGRGLVQCAHCASDQVNALPSGPRVLRHAGTTTQSTQVSAVIPAAPQRPVQSPAPEFARQLFETLAVMARGAEDVGQRFPEEARRIHYDEAPARTIRGQASPQETLELLEEGIFVLPAPVPPEGELH